MFLKYLDDWKKDADTHKNLTTTERSKMMLSRETLEGIHITGKCLILVCALFFFTMLFFYFAVNSFVDMAKYLLSQGQMAFSCLVNESPKIHLKITLASKELEVVAMTTPAFNNAFIMQQLFVYRSH